MNTIYYFFIIGNYIYHEKGTKNKEWEIKGAPLSSVLEHNQ